MAKRTVTTPKWDQRTPGFALRSGLRAGSVMASISTATQSVVAAIPPKLLSFEA